MTDYHSEWYRCATFAPHPVLRRQIVEVAGGYTLTNAEEVGKGPDSLRGYAGGWEFPFRARPLSAVERSLGDNGWSREMPTPGAPPELRKRSGPRGQAIATKRSVRIPDEQWNRLGEIAAREGRDRNAIVNELVAGYVERRQ